jgi:hypothetical protein
MNDVDAGHHLEQLAREKNRACGWRTEVQLSRIGLGICDQLGNRFDRERRSYRDEVWNAKDARDRRNVADEIEIELVEKCRTDRVCGNDIEERVSVRRCPHRRLGADIATCAGSILDYEMLTEPV